MTYQQSVFSLSAINMTNIYQFLPTTWRQKSTGIDMGQYAFTDRIYSTQIEQVCVQLTTAANNMTLPAFAAERLLRRRCC